MADDTDDEELSDIEMLKIAREEAHQTIEYQIDTLNNIDTKAAKILRLNFILIGAVLTGVSATATNQALTEAIGGIQSLLNIHFILGVLFILLSSLLAAVTYTSTTKAVGMSGNDIKNIVQNDHTSEENLEGIVKGYSTWMGYNFRKNVRNAPLGTSINLALISGLIFLSAGVYHGIVGSLGILGNTSILLVLGLFVYNSGIVSQVKRWKDHRGFEHPVFADLSRINSKAKELKDEGVFALTED